MLRSLSWASGRYKRAGEAVWRRLRAAWFWRSAHAALRDPKVQGYVPLDQARADAIASQLAQRGIDLKPLSIDVDDYRQFMARARYESFPHYYAHERPAWLTEKSLEHYVAAKLLRFTPEDVYIDIANDHSPAPDIYHALYGCTSYRQDLSFPPGLRNGVIGGNAAELPVPAGFASKMALHCSFEHFEGDADTRFIREADRVLRPGGRLCILPLYLFTEYAIQTDPAHLPQGGLAFEPDAVLYGARGYRNRHGRFYDVPHFLSRVVSALGGLKLTVFRVTNDHDVAPTCYLEFAALFEKRATEPA